MAEISVIVPVYKVEAYLERCVDSILAQTFTDFELILVDDGSPDNCGVMCDHYAEQDSRITVIHKENGGLSSARNAGLDMISEDIKWVTFVDSDDCIAENCLEVMYNAAAEYGTEVVCCELQKVFGDNEPTMPECCKPVCFSPEDFWSNKEINLVSVVCGRLYHKSLFNEVRFPVGKLHEDEFVSYKLLFQCKKAAYINSGMYFYYQRENSIVNESWNDKHLHAIEAFEYQIAFFAENGYEKALRRSVYGYISRLTESVINLRKYYPGSEKIRIYNKKLKRALRKYDFKNNYLNGSNNNISYYTAFPFEMKIYRFVFKKYQHFKQRL